jgi:hypothetical protein
MLNQPLTALAITLQSCPLQLFSVHRDTPPELLGLIAALSKAQVGVRRIHDDAVKNAMDGGRI